MSRKLAQLPVDAKLQRLTYGFMDHFIVKDTTLWTTTATDTGTATVSDAAGGIIVLSPSDDTVADNDEIYLHNANEIFKFAAGAPIDAEAKVQFEEAATNAANVYVGFMDAFAANALQDDGAGPKASFSGFGFYKKDGELNWHVIFSIGTTNYDYELDAVNSLDGTAHVAGSTSYQRLGLQFHPNGSRGDFLFFIDDVLVYKIYDKVLTSATEMEFGFAVKNGTAAQQAVSVDMVYAYQAVV